MTAEGLDQEEINQCVLNAHGNLTAVKELVSKDRRLATGRAPWDETPLQAASHMGRADIAGYLLDNGAELDFFAAAMLGRRDTVASALESEPGIALTTGVHGMPSLFFPAVSGQIEIAQMMLERGAEINEGDRANTPLHAAAMTGQKEMVRWLLDHGARTRATNFDGKTPEAVARDAGQEEVAAILASHSPGSETDAV